VNPAHLFLGTPADNTADMDAKGRRRTVVASGEAHHNAKLTEASVFALRRAAALGLWSNVQLAKWWGINHGTVARIVARQTWAHVGDDLNAMAKGAAP